MIAAAVLSAGGQESGHLQEQFNLSVLGILSCKTRANRFWLLVTGLRPFSGIPVKSLDPGLGDQGVGPAPGPSSGGIEAATWISFEKKPCQLPAPLLWFVLFVF